MIRRDVLKRFLGVFAAPAALSLSAGAGSPRQQSGAASDPWTVDQTVQPEAFAKELANSIASDKPVIVCVGFRNFYESAHVSGASLHGPSSTTDGLVDLKQYVQGLQRTANLVIYCGCCPLVKCPNVRPAFTLLRDMGFARSRLLVLTQNFAADWMKAGYPVDKSL
jgi:hypothetical protein